MLTNRVHHTKTLRISANSNYIINIQDHHIYTINGYIGQNAKVTLRVGMHTEVLIYCNIGEQVGFKLEGYDKTLSIISFSHNLPLSVKQKIEIERISVIENGEDITAYIAARMRLERPSRSNRSSLVTYNYLSAVFNAAAQSQNSATLPSSQLHQAINNIEYQQAPTGPDYYQFSTSTIPASLYQPPTTSVNNNVSSQQQTPHYPLPHNLETIPIPRAQPAIMPVNNNVASQQQTPHYPLPHNNLETIPIPRVQTAIMPVNNNVASQQQIPHYPLQHNLYAIPTPRVHSDSVNNNLASQPTHFSTQSISIPVAVRQSGQISRNNLTTNTFTRDPFTLPIPQGVPLIPHAPTNQHQNHPAITNNNVVDTIPDSLNQLTPTLINNTIAAQIEIYRSGIIPGGFFHPQNQVPRNNNLVSSQQDPTYSPFLVSYLDSFKDKEPNTDRIEKLNLTSDVEDRAFKGCMCSISKNVMNKPVILHGNKYDFEFLEHWIKQQPTSGLKDPISKVSFILAEIVPDRETNQKIDETIKKIITSRQNKEKRKLQPCNEEKGKDNNPDNNHPDENEDQLNPITKKFKT